MSKLTDDKFSIAENDFNCCYCGGIVTQGEKYLTMDAMYHTNNYCENCARDKFEICDFCGKIEKKSNCYHTRDTRKTVCEHCCYDNRVYRCYECGELFELRDNVYQNAEGRFFCGEHKYNAFINAYGYKPNAEFYFGKNEEHKPNALVTGFELEVQRGDNATKCGEMAFLIDERINKIYFKDKKFLYFKRDGSVSNGFEIVSQPFTQQFFKENIKMFTELLKMLQENNYISHDSDCCGLHFHINRKFLENESDEPTNKMLLFTEYYKDKIQVFSRRQSYHYCKFLSDNISELRYNEIKAKNIEILKKYKNSVGRYSVINNGNRHTVEIRVFRGTLKPETFFATVEFVYNLANVCVEFPITKISWNKIVNNEKSKYIKEYCKSRNILEDRKFMRDFSIDFLKEINKKKKQLRTLQKEMLLELYEMYIGFNENTKILTKTDFNKILSTKEETKTEYKKKMEITNKMYVSQILALIAESFYKENSPEDFYSIVSKICLLYARHKKIFYALGEKNHIEKIENQKTEFFGIYNSIRNDI